jgi:tetratricopeptide (TPR) repeat protein
MRLISAILVTATLATASPDIVRRAGLLYERTAYAESLRLLDQDAHPDAANYFLRGKDYFMSSDYARAVEFFEKALALAPDNSDYELWLGRAWGRRAENDSWFTAMSAASKARQCFERAVALDPRNHEAKNDLFDFYLHAPGFLGGGTDKAEAAARGIATERPAEFEFEEAELAEHRKDFAAAEAHLRRAIELAPEQIGRVLDLAKFLAARGRFEESDRLFDKAAKSGQPRVAFAIASTDLEYHRNPERARRLLAEYLRADLTPDDPPRREAEKLLRRAGGA